MEPIAPLAFSYGWAAGINAYLTVAIYGILGRTGVAEAPDFVQRTEVIAVALAMFAIEFVIDKVPLFDSLWDIPHWIVRPVVGSTLGVAIAGDAGTLDEALAGAGSGATALTSHGVKAGVRLAVNSSPEPFTNTLVSLGEDLAVAGVTLIAASYPWIALTIAALLLVAGLITAALLFKLARGGYRRVRTRLARAGPPDT